MYLSGAKAITPNTPLDNEFVDVMSDDLDIPNAIALIFTQVKKLASLIRGEKFDKFQNLVFEITSELRILGILYTNPLDNTQIKSLIDEWRSALKQKNYILSDKYRQQLIDKKVL
jgi:cysteinyl-tRNA synthetase